MAMVQAAYANNSASVFQARFDRYLNDVLAAPMRSWEVNLGAVARRRRARAVHRRRAAGARVLVVDVPVREPLVLVVALALALVLFASFGVVVGDLRARAGTTPPSSTTS